MCLGVSCQVPVAGLRCLLPSVLLFIIGPPKKRLWTGLAELPECQQEGGRRVCSVSSCGHPAVQDPVAHTQSQRSLNLGPMALPASRPQPLGSPGRAHPPRTPGCSAPRAQLCAALLPSQLAWLDTRDSDSSPGYPTAAFLDPKALSFCRPISLQGEK